MIESCHDWLFETGTQRVTPKMRLRRRIERQLSESPYDRNGSNLAVALILRQVVSVTLTIRQFGDAPSTSQARVGRGLVHQRLLQST